MSGTGKSDVRKPDDVHFLGFRFRCGKEGDVVIVLSNYDNNAQHQPKWKSFGAM
jgi:hypothetical protein